jgi:hypothetical protein
VIYSTVAPPRAGNKTPHTEYKYAKINANTRIQRPEASSERPTLERPRGLAGQPTEP